MKSVDEYTVLASVYDLVMEHVDYEGWVDYILHIVGMQRDIDLEPNERILELGCGTGLFTEELAYQCGASISACDGSEDMLKRTRQRFDATDSRFEFSQLDFEKGWDAFQPSHSFEVILLLYDCINYIHTEAGLDQLFEGVKRFLSEGTVFVFDQSTPANSINNAEFFEDEGGNESVTYIRRSRYDEGTHRHSTEFEITTPEGTFYEKHVQRTWTFLEMKSAIQKNGLEVRAAFDGFSLDPAFEESERIHWVIGGIVDASHQND